MIDLRNFLFHSDYPMDKVVKILSGGPITVSSYASGSATVSHGLPETPLCIMTWSYNSNFSDSRDNSEPGFRYDVPYANVSSDSTNIYINVTNNTNSSKSVYWRVIMFPKPNTTADYTPPTNVNNPFILNTQYNYFKCVLEGESTGGTIAHNLGYKPHVLAWYQSNDGKIHPLTSNILFSSSSPRVAVDNSNIYVSLNGASKIYYRIYADG